VLFVVPLLEDVDPIWFDRIRRLDEIQTPSRFTGLLNYVAIRG
jgi:hypothetical protein